MDSFPLAAAPQTRCLETALPISGGVRGHGQVVGRAGLSPEALRQTPALPRRGAPGAPGGAAAALECLPLSSLGLSVSSLPFMFNLRICPCICPA